MPPLQQDIFSVFSASAEKRLQQVAVTSKKNNAYIDLTYGELYSNIRGFVFVLEKFGVQKGDRVVLLLNNQAEFPIAFFALMSMGAVAVPVDIQYPAEQLAGIVSHCEAKLIVSTHSSYKNRGDALNIDVCLMDHLDLSLANENLNSVDIDPEDTAAIFYTSGTTSAPKGVCLSHKNILANYKSFSKLSFVSSEDVFVSMLPLHHAYAFNSSMLSPLLMGAHITFVGGLSSVELLKCMNLVKATVFIGVPQIYMLLHRSINEQLRKLNVIVRTLSSGTGVFKVKLKKKFGGRLKYFVCGGARIDKEIIRDFESWGFKFLEGYGLTETSPVISFNTPRHSKVGSVGRVLDGVEAKVDHPNSSGIGEIIVKGDNVMSGYYRDKKKTDEVIKDGWFHTGDLGRIDQDGYIFLTGRKTEMIVLPSGKNIFPHELEREYGVSLFIEEIGVLELNGEIVGIVKPDEAYFKKHGVTQIRDRLKWEIDNISDGLPTYKRLKGFVVTKDDLPRTRLGKLMRYQLKELYVAKLNERNSSNSNSADKQAGGDFNALKKKAISIIAKRIKKEPDVSDHMELDLGLDSLNKVELLLEIQEGLGLTLDDEMMEAFFTCSTIGDLLDTLDKFVGNNYVEGAEEASELKWKEVLNEELNEETKGKIKLKFGFLSTLLNFFMIVLIKLICKIFFRLEVVGRENLTKDKPFILCPNHVSYVDAFFIVAALPNEIVLKTYFLGLNIFFENRLIRPFMALMRLIPIEINHNLVEALRSCIYVFRSGKNICYFPEGQRSIDGEVKDFKKGVGILISEFSIPVVPVYIDGAFKVWPRTKKWPRLSKVKVVFGAIKTYIHDESVKSGANERYVYVAQKVRSEVITLSGRL